VPMNVINRLSTSIVQCAPSRKTALFRPPLPPTTDMMFGTIPLSTAFATGVAAWAARRDGEKSRPLKPQFQLCRNEPN
jgi:hypothetical protein